MPSADGSPPTQRDVARRAGVSPRTVSNVVNSFPFVAEDTRAKVLQALQEVGYRPNAAARNLRSGRTGLIGLVLPLNVQYFSELTDFVIQEAARRGLSVVIDKTDGDADREREFLLQGGRSVLFDGLIFSPAGLREEEIHRLVSRTPLVVVGAQPGGSSALDHVLIDNVAAGSAATDHLLRLGRRRIALIGRSLNDRTGTAVDRLRGYRNAMKAAGHRVDQSLIVDAQGFNREHGARAMARLLALPAPPDAVFCYNDPLALGAMRTALSRGLRIPEDLAVVGFDDIEDGRFSTPTLSTVAQDKRQIARFAVDFLVQRLSGKSGPGRTRIASWRLIARESSSPVPADS